MAAIIGLDRSVVSELCLKASSEESIVQPANFNSPEQIVVSGSVTGVKRLMTLAKDAGAKRVIELNVSGAFHSPLMASVRMSYQRRWLAVKWKMPEYRFTAMLQQDHNEQSVIRKLLTDQLTSPVLWSDTIKI